MATELLHTWIVGKEQVSHHGYAVYTLRGSLESPADRVGVFDTATKAVDSMSRLGKGHGVFRLVKSKRGVEPRERIKKEDLPVLEVLNFSQK